MTPQMGQLVFMWFKTTTALFPYMSLFLELTIVHGDRRVASLEPLASLLI